jgi:Spy/CpxP family protein refolding chaperone
MKKWIRNITALFFLVAVIVAGGVCTSEAAGYGHRFDGGIKLITSLNPPLSTEQQGRLQSVLSAYGPALRTLRQQLRTEMRQMNRDIMATPRADAAILADAAAVAKIRTQLKTERAEVRSALSGVLTTDQINQLTQELTARFQRRLDARIDYLLLNYTRNIDKQ